MKEGTGRGAGGSQEQQPPFPGRRGHCASCFAGCWRKVGAAHPTKARTALGQELGGCGDPQGQESH